MSDAEQHGFEDLCRVLFHGSEFVFVDWRVNIGVWQSVIPNVQSCRPK